MKKKFNLFFAVVLAMTMLFGSTLCFAAELNNDVGKLNSTARTQRNAVIKSINISGTSGIVYVNLTYGWDEGFEGWFYDASFAGTNNEITDFYYLTHTVAGGSYITVTVSCRAGGSEHTVSQQFHVDEWGDVY